jgi:hypothetical protein
LITDTRITELNLERPSTEMLEPHRENALKDTEEPMFMKSNTETALPTRTNERIEKLEPT